MRTIASVKLSLLAFISLLILPLVQQLHAAEKVFASSEHYEARKRSDKCGSVFELEIKSKQGQFDAHDSNLQKFLSGLDAVLSVECPGAYRIEYLAYDEVLVGFGWWDMLSGKENFTPYPPPSSTESRQKETKQIPFKQLTQKLQQKKRAGALKRFKRRQDLWSKYQGESWGGSYTSYRIEELTTEEFLEFVSYLDEECQAGDYFSCEKTSEFFAQTPNVYVQDLVKAQEYSAKHKKAAKLACLAGDGMACLDVE